MNKKIKEETGHIGFNAYPEKKLVGWGKTENK